MSREPRFLRDHEPPQLLPSAGRVPPHDLAAEAAVLSAILLDPTVLDRVLEILKPEHFYSEANRRIYEAAVELSKVGTPIDLATVAAYLRDRERLAQVGGSTYLAQIVDATPAVANVEAHAKIVFRKWRVRQAILLGQQMAAEGYGDVGDEQEWIDGCEQRIYQIARTSEVRTSSLVGPLVRGVFEQITELAARGERITGTPTGFDRLDAKTAGLHDGELTIVAARPGMGKTAWVMNVAENAAAKNLNTPDDQLDAPRVGVAAFSLEMLREQLATRMVCSRGRVDLGRLRNGSLGDRDWQSLSEAAAFMWKLPIWIDDTAGLTVLELRARVRRLQAEYDKHDSDGRVTQRIGLVIIDYLQLMRGTVKGQSREQEISEISRGLKAMSKELRLPVIALSQLNRSVETRGTKDKRPQLSDLRESGAIEQDADNIIFIYRDDYYESDSPMKGIAELILAKQRQGPTGKVKVRFESYCTRFENLADSEYDQYASDDD